MIFVTLGTVPIPFTRLAKKVDEVARGINEEVIIQYGYTKYPFVNVKAFKFVSSTEMSEFIKNASIIITHGGYGTISECQHAFNRDIPIFLISEYEDWTDEVPGWLQALATRSFTDWDSLYEYLAELPERILIKDRYGNRHAEQQYLCSLCGTAFVKNKHQFVSKVSPLYCSPCVDLITKTWEKLEDRYEFFANMIEHQALEEMTKQRMLDL